MTTRELIALLQALDPSGDKLVTEQRYSDDRPMSPESWAAMTLYRQNGGEWYTENSYRLDHSKPSDPVDVIHYSGN